MTLPIYKDDDKNFMLMQSQWSTQLNTLLSNHSLQSIILHKVLLISGTNTINHKLGRKLQGWRIVRQRSAASIYDNQDSNQMSNLTLILISSADVVVDLEVF